MYQVKSAGWPPPKKKSWLRRCRRGGEDWFILAEETCWLGPDAVEWLSIHVCTVNETVVVLLHLVELTGIHENCFALIFPILQQTYDGLHSSISPSLPNSLSLSVSLPPLPCPPPSLSLSLSLPLSQTLRLTANFWGCVLGSESIGIRIRIAPLSGTTTSNMELKGALYRICCSVNRLGDSGVKV